MGGGSEVPSTPRPLPFLRILRILWSIPSISPAFLTTEYTEDTETGSGSEVPSTPRPLPFLRILRILWSIPSVFPDLLTTEYTEHSEPLLWRVSVMEYQAFVLDLRVVGEVH